MNVSQPVDTPSEDLRAALLPVGPPRPDPIHIPYVVAAALFALVNGVCFHIPIRHPAWYVMSAVGIIAFVLHVTWLSRLYRDCKRVLTGILDLGETRMRFLTVFTAPVYLIWAPFALRLLFRCARIKATERGHSVASVLARYEDNALALQRGGWLAVIVSIVVMVRLSKTLEPYSATGTSPESMDFELLLGPTMLWSETIFKMVLGAAYVWFVATSIPILYRNLPKLTESSGA